MNDHDLLVEIKTKLERAILDIKELKDNTAARVTALEEEKLNQREFTVAKDEADKLHADHERRIRRLERLGFTAIGALGLIEIVANIYSNLHR